MPLYCQRDYCRHLLDADGDYPAIVKRNRRELYAAIALAFTTATTAPDGSYRQARPGSGGAGRGGRWETPRLCTANALNGYLDWPEWSRCFGLSVRCDRRERKPSTPRCATLRDYQFELGSWGRPVRWARCGGIGKLKTGCIRCGMSPLVEDASQVRKRAGPQVMALLRNITLSLPRRGGFTNIAAALRQLGWQPGEALRRIGLPNY